MKDIFCVLSLITICWGNEAKIREVDEELITYGFSSPREYVDFGRLYPYHRFDYYSPKGEKKKWKMIELENDYIKLWITPEIGGKIWGAIDKKTGKEFIYFNHVVKFRDVATRGAWTSGGVELNFGVIGHSPWCSTPVDYVMNTHEDGSVSCTVGGRDLALDTDWRVQIVLPPDKAHFETKVLWNNTSGMERPYYQWMNAGVKSKGNLEYVYPGSHYLGHEGDVHPWKIDGKGRDLSWYEKNDFGHLKSFHVSGVYSDFFGGYWHDDQFGFGHSSAYADKLGKKIWIWGLSPAGMIWEKLLTDNDGQYSEIQSGRIFNQTAGGSYKSPFKHAAFLPGVTESWTEYWYPVGAMGGMTYSSPEMAFLLGTDEEKPVLKFYAHRTIDQEMSLIVEGKELLKEALTLKPTEQMTLALPSFIQDKPYQIYLNGELYYDTTVHEKALERPTVLSDKFDHTSAYGLFIRGKEYEKQNFMKEAGEFYQESLDKDPYFVPSLVGLAQVYYNQHKNEKALELAKRALEVDTYIGGANYVYGLIQKQQGKDADALDGFSVATFSPEYRAAAYYELASMGFVRKEMRKAEEALSHCLAANPQHLQARELGVIMARVKGDEALYQERLDELLTLDPLNYVGRWEKLGRKESSKDQFTQSITNEYRHESFIDIARVYMGLKLYDEAQRVLMLAPEQAKVLLWKAYLAHLEGKDQEAQRYLETMVEASPELVIPHRLEEETMLDWAMKTNKHWKLKYYNALIKTQFDKKVESLALLLSCEEEPDYYPFYIQRAKLVEDDDQEKEYKKALECAPDNFNTSLCLANYYMGQKQYDKARPVLEAYYKKDAENAYVALRLCTVYKELKEWDKAIEIMEKLEVLPCEGAMDGRTVWREANLYKAFDYLMAMRYDEARASLAKARQWPENLGVGRPYDNLTDERMEDICEWYATAMVGKPDEALLKKIIRFQEESPEPHVYSTALWSALAMRRAGDKEKAQALLNAWKKSDRKNNAKIARWAEALYNHRWDDAGKIATEEEFKEKALPFQVIVTDRDFELMCENAELFRKIQETLMEFVLRTETTL